MSRWVAAASQAFLSGSGAPANALGVDGQKYLDTLNGVLYGPKSGGAWPTPGITLTGESISVAGLLRGDRIPQPWLSPLQPTTRLLNSAGRIYLIRYVPPRARTLTLAAVGVTTAATVNDPLEVGIYSSAAPTLTRLATSGTQTAKLNAIGISTVPLSFTVDPGTVYYVAFTNATIGGTGATVAAATTNDVYGSQMFGVTPPTIGFGILDGALSGGLLPATITSASVGWGNASGQSTIPSVALREI